MYSIKEFNRNTLYITPMPPQGQMFRLLPSVNQAFSFIREEEIQGLIVKTNNNGKASLEIRKILDDFESYKQILTEKVQSENIGLPKISVIEAGLLGACILKSVYPEDNIDPSAATYSLISMEEEGISSIQEAVLNFEGHPF